MKMENEFKRYYIKIRVKLGIKPVDIHRELVSALGEDALSYDTVLRWANKFSAGREETKDDQRSGRPVTTYTNENIEKVRILVQQNPHITYDEIEEETSINRYSINEILHLALNLKKVTSRWVPHNLTDQNRQIRVEYCKENLAIYRDGPGRLCDILTEDESWFYHRKIGKKSSNACWIGEGETPKTVVRRNRFEPKTLFSIFFRTSGPVLVHAVPGGKTIDSNYYIENCLEPAFDAVSLKRKSVGTKSIKLLHDNAKPHCSQAVKNYLEHRSIKLIKHPPYSPDLAPCDYWLFDYIKCNLEDQIDEESLIKAVTKILSTIPASEYKKTFDKWIERLELCANNEGHYFEHKIK